MATNRVPNKPPVVKGTGEPMSNSVPLKDLQQQLHQYKAETSERAAKELLGVLIQKEQYVGEVYSLGYETALVQIHDSHRQEVGGIPSLSFLIATRLLPDREIRHSEEDSSIILLRVMDAAPLPNHAEAERIRVESAQQVTGEDGVFWDHAEIMDGTTANLLSFAGVKCRVIGTFYLEPDDSPKGPLPLRLRFGSDISNYYPNRGLKVYKPNGDALRRIVNYRDASRDLEGLGVAIGVVRYASTNRSFQGVSDVQVEVLPEDLLAQKTALFGMTRIGKSNTTKVMLKSVFDLRHLKNCRVGQIVFDPNGEYANDNVQDGDRANPTALRNIWRAHPKGSQQDVVTYGTRRHPSDPTRRLMLLNFFEEANLQTGKGIIDDILSSATAHYISNFRQVTFTKPIDIEVNRSAQTRYDRRVLVYCALLARAGFEVPQGFSPNTNRLFSKDLREAMRTSESANATDYSTGATFLERPNLNWDQLAQALEYLDTFVHDSKSGYNAFNTKYMTDPKGSGDPWADEDLKKLLRMFSYANGPKLIAGARPYHTSSTREDYASEIYSDLRAGKLVIVDQSGGDEGISRASAARIMGHIFRQNQEAFRNSQVPPDILVYVEEAHTLLPSSSELDTGDVWVKTAKEGAKYRLGLVYATQEVSSIQRNILKNTSNWFIGHLNNTDETKELVKYYDFGDFELSIRRAQDKGFLRVKTLSNLFVVPVQVKQFRVD